jgi:c-di-GMP-binding flagellar brake protein YcgR
MASPPDPRPALPEADADGVVTGPAEVHELLQRIADAAVPVRLSSPAGDSLLTRLQSVDAEGAQLSFAVDGEPGPAQRLALADGAVARAWFGTAPLQFDVGTLLVVRGASGCTLRSRLPAQVLRAQRRQAFRVRATGRPGPSATLRHPSMPEMRVALRIVDVSAGGCALLVPDNLPALQPGTRLNGVCIELDGGTRFDAALQLQHVSMLHGAPCLGCAFVGLEGAAQRALQRWIDRTQQRQRRLAGAAPAP